MPNLIPSRMSGFERKNALDSHASRVEKKEKLSSMIK